MSEHFPKPKYLRANGKTELDLYQQVFDTSGLAKKTD